MNNVILLHRLIQSLSNHSLQHDTLVEKRKKKKLKIKKKKKKE